jgi:RNA polymerase sigma factor (sigma-70 family)
MGFMIVRTDELKEMADAIDAGLAVTAGIEQPFEEFFRDEYGRLAKACLLLTGDPHEAEELAQEALARAYERWDRVRQMESPEGYVYRTALNLNRNRLRGLRVRSRRASVQTVGAGPEAAAEARHLVLQALAALTREQREAVVLVGWLGFDAEEAGRLLGIAPGSVRGRVHRARILLRERFGGEQDE